MEYQQKAIKPGFFFSMVLGFVLVYYAIAFILLLLALIFNSYVLEISDTYHADLHLSKFSIIVFLAIVAFLHLLLLAGCISLFWRVAKWQIVLILSCMSMIMGVQMLATGFMGYQKYIVEGIILLLIAGLFFLKPRKIKNHLDLNNTLTES